MGSLDQDAKYYDQRWSAFQYANLYGLERCVFILQSIVSLELENPRICDLGCGAGWLTGILSTLGPTVGVDLSPAAVNQAAGLYPRAQFICSDATQWNPEPGAFDIVVSQEVIEHIRNKEDYLRVVFQALRPGGYLILTTPNLDTLNAVSPEERKAVWEIQPVELPVNRGQLDALLRGNGFTVVRRGSAVVGCGKLGFHRLLNSHKVAAVLSALGLGTAWRSLRGRSGYGMYLTTVARK
ncbi:MAG: methyltransferase domain-containing protein [Acidobacteriota bacterium]|nr:methyltransferase domain-containing protein [Acidobacteriota bacterium]